MLQRKKLKTETAQLTSIQKISFKDLARNLLGSVPNSIHMIEEKKLSKNNKKNRTKTEVGEHPDASDDQFFQRADW